MSGHLTHGANAEPNLTPMLDMVFQLVTFFMLVINFKAASYDLSLELPVVGSAAPVDTHGQDLVILNIDKDGHLQAGGARQKDIDHYISTAAMFSKNLAIERNADFDIHSSGLPTIVVVRADIDTPFQLLNRVLKSCKLNGYHNFSMKTTNKRQPRPNARA